MTWSTITGAGTTTATKFFGDVMNKINNMLNGSDVSDAVVIHSNVTWTFKGSALKVKDASDTYVYTLAGGTIGANRTITFPALTGNDVLMTADFAQTAKNKTFEDSTTYFADNSDTTKKFQFQASGITTATTRTYTVPDYDATLATLAGNEALTNKTIGNTNTITVKDANFTIQDDSDTTKQAVFQLSGITTGTTRTYTLPNASVTLAGINLAQTFTAAQTFTTGLLKLADIFDSNGVASLAFTATSSAVNYATLANSATGNAVTMTMTGSDSNIDYKIVPKGTGAAYGFVETIEVPLSSDSATSAPSTGVVYTSLPMPADFNVIGCVLGVKTAGTGANLVRADVLVENSVNADAFTTVFSTKPTIDASEFTSTTAATPYVFSSNPTVIAKGKRVQYKIDQIDSNSLARGYKVGLIGYYSAKPSG